jgi:hypothetical protein
MKALGLALMRNDSLEELYISRNKFGIIGLTLLATGLKNNTGLAALYLDGNSIGGDGAAVIADALSSNTSLTSWACATTASGMVERWHWARRSRSIPH